MADLNKLRQVNPHWKPSKSFIEDQEAAKQKAEADKYDGDIDPVQKVLAQQIEELEHADGIKEMVDKQTSTPRFTTKKHLNEVHNKLWGEDYYKNEEMNPSKYTQNDIAQTKDAIKEKILRHFDDALFEMVNEEMSKYYLFQSSNYLTEAGYDMFEDEWFEFYHEHHGDILFQVKTEINM